MVIKSTQEVARIHSLLVDLPLVRGLSPGQIGQIYALLERREVTQGEVLMAKGVVPEHFAVVVRSSPS